MVLISLQIFGRFVSNMALQFLKSGTSWEMPEQSVSARKHFTAIYKYEKRIADHLLKLAGDSYPEGFATDLIRCCFYQCLRRRSNII